MEWTALATRVQSQARGVLHLEGARGSQGTPSKRATAWWRVSTRAGKAGRLVSGAHGHHLRAVTGYHRRTWAGKAGRLVSGAQVHTVLL